MKIISALLTEIRVHSIHLELVFLFLLRMWHPPQCGTYSEAVQAGEGLLEHVSCPRRQGTSLVTVSPGCDFQMLKLVSVASFARGDIASQ